MQKWLIRLTVFACCVIGADGLLWLVGTRMLSATAHRWALQAVSHGWTVTPARPSLCPCDAGGWPFAASIVIPGVSVAGGERLLPGGVSWSTGQLVLSVSLLHPLTLSVGLEGQQVVRVSHAPAIAFEAGSITAAVPLGSSMPIRGDLRALAVEGGIDGARHPQDVRLDALHLQLAETAGGEAGFTGRLQVEARGIGLPDTRRWALGGFITHAAAELDITSPKMPFWDTQPGRDSITARAQAEAWRDGGGTLGVRGVDIQWGPLDVKATADLRLDDRLQPAGTGTADMAGTGATLKALADAGILPAGMAATAGAVLAVMPHAPMGRDGSGPSAVRLAFVLRGSTLSVGQIPLVHVNDIAWGGQSPM